MVINRCLNCMSEIESYPCPHCGYDGSGVQEWKGVLDPGTVIGGRYLLGRAQGLARYIGFDLMREQRVVIWPCATPGNEELQEILAEERKLMQLRNLPGIAIPYDVVEQNHMTFVITGYQEGKTLKDHIRNARPMAWTETVRLFLPIMRSLERLHMAGIVHRGICPKNLILSADGTLVLGGFGAWQYEFAEEVSVLGLYLPVCFAPVERFMTEKKVLGPWSDVYALAATMLYAATGYELPEAPQRLESDTLNLNAMQFQTIPAAARQALSHALKVQPKQRTQSIAAFASELGQNVSAASTFYEPTQPTGGVTEAVVQEKKALPRWVVSAVGAAIALAVGIGINSSSGREKNVVDVAQDTAPHTEISIPAFSAPVVTETPTEAIMGEVLEEKVIPSSAAISYEYYEDHISVKGYTGSPEEVVIPSEVDGLPVTEIEKYAFSSCESLESIVIPETVTAIDSGAFYQCSSLAKVTLPDSITTISNAAFSNCSNLTGIELPKTVTVIEKSAFRDCVKLADIQLPEDLETIGDFAFSSCAALTSVTIANAETISKQAFYDCTKLKSVAITGDVETIADSAFYNCGALESLTISGNVGTIETYAFGKCKALTEVEITGSVDRIEENAFLVCNSLKYVELPEKTKASNGAFPSGTTIERKGATGAAAPTSDFSAGKVSGNTYRNDYLGIRCALGDNWEFSTTSELAEVNGIEESQQTDEYLEKACLENSYTLMQASTSRSGAVHVVSMSCLRMPEDYARVTDSILEQVLEGRLEGLVENLEGMGVTDIEHEITTEELLGREQPALRIGGDLQGTSVNTIRIVKVVGECILEVTVISIGADLPNEVWEEYITAT